MFNVRIGICSGVFDLLHVGHIRMLEEAKTKCDYLLVLVQVDPTIENPNKNKPVQSLAERTEQLLALRVVDEVIYYNSEKEFYDILLNAKYDVRIMGSDWEGKEITGGDIAGHLEKCYFHKRNHNFSTTELRERVYLAEQTKRNIISSNLLTVKIMAIQIFNFSDYDLEVWVTTKNLEVFDNKTPEQLVLENKTEDLIKYLTSLQAGFAG